MDSINLGGAVAATPSVRRDAAAVSLPVASAVRKGAEPVAGASAQEIHSAMDKLHGFVQDAQRNLNFSVDEASGQFVVKVVDGDSGKLIRQIPSEDLLRLAEQLESMRSLLFKAEA